MKFTGVVSLCLFLAWCYAGSTAEAKIYLRTGPVEPGAVQHTLAADSGRDYYILQFRGPIQQEWKHQVSACGVELLDYLPDFAFTARADSPSIHRAAALPFVNWTGEFLPEYRVSPALSKAKGQVRVNVQMFPGESASAVSAEVTAKGGRVEASSNGSRITLRAAVPVSAIAALSRVRGVSWIEPYIEPKLTNQISRGIIGASTVYQDLGLYGAGQIVAVADTGLDNGANNSTMSADFQGRILKSYPLGRKNDWSDIEGHGTHVCGSILGSGVLSGSVPANHDYVSSFAGMAPEAQLIIQSVADRAGRLSGLPTDLNNLFSPIYTDGARIHSNSWGAAYMGVYTTDSQNVDEFLWNHKDMTILFSAGNSGIDSNRDGVIDLDSLDAPATAKDCITVGATESTISSDAFTYGAAWPSDYPSDPISSDYVSDNASGMAAFSSRGPTDDGRIKPDICAPGTNIVSCRSHANGAGVLWGAYNNDYAYSGGTSMSTPITAGAAALLREYLVTAKGMSDPSGALVKAAILNSAADIYPGQYGTGPHQELPSHRPNNVEGWGRLDIRSATQPASPRMNEFVDASGLTTGQTDRYTYNIQNTGVPLQVTLAWTDYYGALQAAKELVNDLDLVVTAPGGQQYKGNNTTDRLNNVETVDILSPVDGTYTVTVTAYNVPQGPQPYALAITGGMEAPLAVSTVSQAKSEPDGTVISVTGKTVTAGTESFANRFYVEDNDRSSGIMVSYTGGPVSAGNTVTVVGHLATVDGERVINADSVTVTSP